MVGTIGSFIGAIMIGLFGYVFGLSNMIVFFIIIAGFLSALFDSILGGTVQARFIFIITGEISEKQTINNHKGFLYTGWNWVNNDMVNLLSTIFGPCLLIILLNYYS